MDRLIYTVASGTKHIMDKQATTAQNLANVSTTGFRAQIDAFRAVPIKGDGMETRVMVETDTVGADFSSGALQVTGRELDVAVRGKGWIALQMPDGTEAYTRNGALQTSPNGLLLTAGGQTVAGEGGPITIPPETAVMVGADGTIATMPNGVPPAISTVLGRIKLVSPPDADMARGEDGLFRLKTNGNAPSDPQVVIASGTLESSNVNAVDAMVDMISLARSFETQMSLLKNAENNAAKASQLFALG